MTGEEFSHLSFRSTKWYFSYPRRTSETQLVSRFKSMKPWVGLSFELVCHLHKNIKLVTSLRDRRNRKGFEQVAS